MGAARTPARPASAEPNPNTAVTHNETSMPKARVMVGFSVQARMTAPTRVRSMMNQVSEQITTETTMAKRRKVGKAMNPRLVAPEGCGGGAYGWPEIP